MFNIMNSIFLSKVKATEGDFPSYLKALKDGRFDDRFFFGISDKTRGFLLLNPFTDPGGLYCGGMGSGKSIACKTTVFTHMLANSEKTIYILYDQLKGMGDYKIFFDKTDNVAFSLNDEAKIIPTIDMMYEEVMARRKEFERVGVNGLLDYEKYRRKTDPNYPGLARIVFVAEEFHSITSSNTLKFGFNSDKKGTAAFQLKELMRIGRSYGLTLLAATQRALSEDIPSTLRAGISMMQAFRVNSIHDVGAMNVPHVEQIRHEMQGRGAYADGFVQYPFIPDSTMKVLFDNFYKPLKAETLKYSVSDFRVAFMGEGNSGMVLIKPFVEIVKNANQFDPVEIALRYLQVFDFKTTYQTNEAFHPQVIAERDGKRYAVSVFAGREERPSEKTAQSIKESMKYLKVDSFIAISIDGPMANPISNLAKSVDGISIDVEDLLKIGGVLDNKEKLESSGSFDEVFSGLILSRKEEEEGEEEEDADEDNVDSAILDKMKNDSSFLDKFR